MYTIRSEPQLWHTSNGIFSAKKVGNLDLVFPEYLHSKRMHIAPNIIEFKDEDQAPMFGLIIGTDFMQQLGIVLDFKIKMITIDEIIALPMRKLTLTTICSQMEPIATLHETKRVVKILDAKYEKANLPKVISDIAFTLILANKRNN